MLSLSKSVKYLFNTFESILHNELSNIIPNLTNLVSWLEVLHHHQDTSKRQEHWLQERIPKETATWYNMILLNSKTIIKMSTHSFIYKNYCNLNKTRFGHWRQWNTINLLKTWRHHDLESLYGDKSMKKEFGER